MGERKYISRKEYLDSPEIYGQHTRYWASLDPLSKIATIRRVGLFGFLREVFGYADAERIRERLEERCAALTEECSAAQESVKELTEKNQALEEELAKITEKVTESSSRLLNPPSAASIMNAFNRMCPEHTEWFFHPHEDLHTGVIKFSHNCMFYPFNEISVPRGKLRLCDRYGYPVCLTQCYAYAALPAKYAQHLIPDDFHVCKMRVLFVTNDTWNRQLWLADPLSAQDVLLEICADRDKSNWNHEKEAIDRWKRTAGDGCHCRVVYGPGGTLLFDMIVSIEEFLGMGQNRFSREQIKRIRDQCYTEYLDLYFKGD